ncbi:MAG: translation initiation factor IF-2 [Acidobacteriia bacterium]|nr:translation initiation factor IF-2 [Terriglobia bacterium]
MSKIRINELARELEVKPSKIIDMLPELGIAEKKTHSSSLEDDLVPAIRNRLAEESASAPAKPKRKETSIPTLVSPSPTAPLVEAMLSHQRVEPGVTPAKPPSVEASSVETSAEKAMTPVEKQTGPPRSIPQPIRPPLAVSGQQRAPSIPIPPRQAVPAVPSASITARPAAPKAGPSPHPGASLTPTSQAPPAPSGSGAPRPGQILSGPRQPMPPAAGQAVRSGPGAPAMPPPGSTVPSIPRPASRPSPAPPTRVIAPGPAQPQNLGAQSRTGLAGQPQPRPVVPPRADLVARLSQTPPRTSMPGQPAAPRPYTPRSATPVPGQPIYRGPIRPGQPLVRGPGVPAGSGPPRPGMRGRGMHPTSPLPSEPSAVPTTDTRRHAAKPRTASRERELQEGRLRPIGKPREAEVVAVNKDITIGEGITVKELSEKMGIKASLVIKRLLLDRKVFATINQTLDMKMAEDLAASFGAKTSQMTFEEEKTQEVDLAEDTQDQIPRAPVVTVMGHVDHGKTSLLDSIRMSNVAEREAGGITQHIGAYQIHHNGKKIVFIDTPGHEAFTRMRARGAKVTDIVVLVVAADDGVMPQTIEAIDHAKAAGVPIIVAINKIDKAEAQIDRIKQQLSDRGLLAEDWGGDVVMVPVSAKTKQNLDLLLEMVLLVAELHSLKANHARPGVCTILEAKLDRGRGPVATVLVRNGILRVGDYFICGTVFSKVRALVDDQGDMVKEAEPSTPVEVLGLDTLPEVGETLQVITDTAKAKQIVLYREVKVREEAMAKNRRVTLETLHEQLKEGEIKELNVILKADVGGSAEVVSETLQKLSNDKVRIRVLHSGVGAITETDVLLASASEAVVIGFNVRPDRAAASTAEKEKVDLRLHTIIYEMTQEIKKAMVGLLEPVFKEIPKGRAVVREVFKITKVGIVAGCLVQEGTILRNCQVRLLRDNVVVHTGKIEGLRRFKDDASEVKSGLECGITIANYSDIKPNDIIEAFIMERVAHDVFA